MSYTDFNDLHVSQGLYAVREQLFKALQSPVISKPAANDAQDTAPDWMTDDIPASAYESEIDPSLNPPKDAEPLMTVEKLVQRYLLTMPDAKIWDAYKKQLIKKHAFVTFVGKKLFDQWNGHEDRRTVDQASIMEQARAAQVKQGSGVNAALSRYIYIYPTDRVWDGEKKDSVPISSLKYAIAEHFDDWLKHPQRKQIDEDQLKFDPTQKLGSDCINTFRGLPLVPRSDTSCKNIKRLVAMLCNDDPEVYLWLCRWLALPLQKVGTKMATAILMHSDVHGSGKSLLFDGIVKQLYGEYAATLGQHQLESQYTDWRARKLFGLFEEVLSRDQKYTHTGTIKHMITGTTHRIEKKFVSGWEEANHMNAVFLSNEVQPFPLEESDRRLMVIWPEKKLPDSLQADVVVEMENGGIEAFYHYLLTLDLQGFNAHSKPLMTEAKERLIDFGRPGWDLFYREWERDSLDVPYMTCLAKDLYRYYERWCRRMGERSLSASKLVGFLRTKVRYRRDLHYNIAQGKYKGNFFVVGIAPVDMSQQIWLSECVQKFRLALEADNEA
jgi:putative DNA primase/helicase